VAETILIVFIVFILLGMPISIAMGVGALGAAIFYPVLNPVIIPTSNAWAASSWSWIGAGVGPSRSDSLTGAGMLVSLDVEPRH